MAQSEFTGGEIVSEDNSPDEGTEKEEETGQVHLERMYLKDASFESPNSPGIFRESWEPEIDLQVNTRTQHVVPDSFEVVLTATITARQGEKTAFIVEVQQAGLFRMEGLEDQVLHRTLGTFCPNLIFPYIREAVDSLVIRGGYPPLNLVPINFDTAYEEAMLRARNQPQGGDAPTTH